MSPSSPCLAPTAASRMSRCTAGISAPIITNHATARVLDLDANINSGFVVIIRALRLTDLGCELEHIYQPYQGLTTDAPTISA